MDLNIPDIIQDYALTLTTPEGVVYSAEKYPWTERDFFLNMKWGYKAFSKAEEDITKRDLAYMFDKNFITSLFYGRNLSPESTHFNYTLYKVDGVNLGFSETELYIDSDGVKHVTNVGHVVAPELRGQKHSKYMGAMQYHGSRYFTSVHSEIKVNLRHGSPGARKNWQNMSDVTPAQNENVFYNDAAGEYVQSAERPTQSKMMGIYNRIATFGEYSTTNPDEYWKDSPKTDAKWAHPLNTTTPDFTI